MSFDIFTPNGALNDTNTPQEDTNKLSASIKVVGVGSGGVNAVNSMIDAKVSNVEFYAINTDNAMLMKSKCDNKIQIGKDGFGVGGDPKKGKQCANESIDDLKDMLSGADMVFITTGMGGGTGTGAAPVIAELAKEQGILTVGVVTRPFTAEGQVRIDNADKGIKEIKQFTDALIVIPNDNAYQYIDEKTPLDTAFGIIDQVLRRAIESITDTITKTGKHINIDFADVKKVLTDSEYVVIGLSDGKDCKEALEKALDNVLVEGPNIKDAENVLINISCSINNPLTLADRKLLDDIIRKDFSNCKFSKVGDIVSNSLDTRVKVSIIASSTKKATIQTDLFEDTVTAKPKETIKSSNKFEDLEKSVKPKFEPIKNITEDFNDDVFSKPAYEFWELKWIKKD